MAEVSYDVPIGLPDAGLLTISAQRIMSTLEASEREEAVQTLFKLVDGVLMAPQEQKKRRVRKNNEVFHKKVGRHTPAIDFLRAVGFVESDDPEMPGELGKDGLLSMPVAFLSRITDAHHTLARVAREAGLAAPPLPTSGGFNPYQSSSQATDTTRSTKAPEDWKSEADKIRDEVKRKEIENEEKLEAAEPVDLEPTAFWLSAGRRLEEVIREATNPSEERQTDNAILVEQVASAKGTITGSSTKFENADKKRLADLSRKRVYDTCIIRVICPDKSVLQVKFRAKDKGSDVTSQLEPLLAPHVREARWYIYQSPPMKRLAPRETLVAAGFTPGANVYLGFEDQKPPAPYLEDSLVAQLGPAPEIQRGCAAFGAPIADGPTFSGEAMGWGSGKRLGGPGAPSGSGEAATAGAGAAQPAPTKEA
eukprot:TRINITY_DN64139_c0_g1_i1.p1 TRINITY_DN64139_c0_g1~~TRINITY_DN64139_c0_g1_i1.p1  ORF type:complete len:422 (-),score=85.37 TRINITY_DN64139_c0_g1_i1:115-1380(-)